MKNQVDILEFIITYYFIDL